MEKISVAEARRAEAIGREGDVAGLGAHAPRLQGRLQLPRTQRRLLPSATSRSIAEAALPNYESEVLKLSAGCSVTVEGVVRPRRPRGSRPRSLAKEVTVHGWADPATYPLQKKGHSLEFLREKAHLRPRSNTFGAVARVRNQVCMSIHQFFQEQGFLYVHPPIITASDCEGAGQMFRVTTLDLAKPPRDAAGIDYKQDFFGRPTYLTVSGQLEAEIFACALGKVYTFGPTFRAENSNTSRHLAEFWMVEPEMAFFELTDNMDLAEAFLKRICRDVLERCAEDMQFFQERIDPTVRSHAGGHCDQPVRAPAVHRGGGHPVRSRARRSSSRRRGAATCRRNTSAILTEKHFQKPVILYDYPRTIKAFYMRLNDDGKTVRAMDVLVPAGRRDHRRQPARGAAGRAGDADEGAGPRPGGVLVVPRPAALRHRAALGLRPGPGADGAVRDGHGQHPRRDPVPADAGERGVLRAAMSKPFDATLKDLIQSYPGDFLAALDEPAPGPVEALNGRVPLASRPPSAT